MKSLFAFLWFFIFITTIQAQPSIINGSFENTTATLACWYNRSNAEFNGYMTDVNAFGTAQETDILTRGCYNSSIPDGVRALGIAGNPSDEVAMKLSAPLVAGNTYTLSFYAYSQTSFSSLGNLQIGASTSNNAFGTLLYTAVPVVNTWTNYTFTFNAPNNATHITVRNEPGGRHWNHIDNFELAVPLPVELLNFSAKPVDKHVELKWQTASEINNDYFIIERSQDGLQWEKLKRIDGAGNSSTTLTYSARDERPYKGMSYYRLKQTDFNGQFEYSDIKSVNTNGFNSESVIIHPNPTNGVISISGTKSELAEIKIFNTFGQDISKVVNIVHTNETSATVNLSNLSQGMYYVKTKTKVSKVYKE